MLFVTVCVCNRPATHAEHRERENRKKQKIIEQYLTAIVVCFELFC